MNRRQRMYESNQRARNFLLEFLKVDEVWFKKHGRRKDRIFTQNGHYYATDLFNLFDGIAITKSQVYFFQVKTNAWPPTIPLNQWAVDHKNITVFAINVRNTKKGWRVFHREYPYE